MRFATAGAVYTYDADRRTLKRSPILKSAAMRDDGEELPVYFAGVIAVGYCGYFVIELTDGTVTLRTTSNVVSVTE